MRPVLLVLLALLVLVAAGSVLASRMLLATPRGRLAADRWLLRLPVVGEVIVKTEVARFLVKVNTHE